MRERAARGKGSEMELVSEEKIPMGLCREKRGERAHSHVQPINERIKGGLGGN